MSQNIFTARCATIFCVTLTIAVLAVATVHGQSPSDEAAAQAPWQAPPDCGDSPYWSSPACDDCGDGPCDDFGDCGPCDVPQGCEFRYPWLCGLDALFGCDRLWFRTEYLLWWNKAADLPALATTSPQGTDYANAGVLDATGTTVLFGYGADPGARSGVRFTLGTWLNDCHDLGLEANYFFLSSKGDEFSQTSGSSTILARPFYDVTTAAQNAVVLAYSNPPNDRRVQTGSLDIRNTNELNMADAIFRQAVMRGCGQEVDLLFGYRYGRFDETLSVNSSTTFVSGFVTPDGTIVQVSDLFDAGNEFHGAEFGVAGRSRFCRLTVEWLGKLAIGSTQSRVNVRGSTISTTPGAAPIPYDAGILALESNRRTYDQSQFSVIPELGVTLGYDLTCRLRATVGYTLVYWSRVARPGDLVDTHLNPTQFPPDQLEGLPAPEFTFTTTDYWAQGLSLGLDYRF